MLEQAALVLEQAAQQLRPVALVAREQDHVMRARDGLDAVDLDEAQALDQREQAVGRELAAGRLGEPREREREAPCRGRLEP